MDAVEKRRRFPLPGIEKKSKAERLRNNQN
jgi:hypothetical protein